MKRSPDRAPKPKAGFLADCRARFPGLGERGFNRAWAAAIELIGATGWRKPGRRQLGSSPLDVDEQLAPLLETPGGTTLTALRR
jgi:hypothetical protein